MWFLHVYYIREVIFETRKGDDERAEVFAGALGDDNAEEVGRAEDFSAIIRICDGIERSNVYTTCGCICVL